MSVPRQLQVSGSASVGPVAGNPAVFPSLQDGIDLAVQQTYAEGKSSGQTLNSPSSFLDLLASNPMSAVRFLCIRVQGGIMTLQVTSQVASAQQIPISDVFYISNPLQGSEFTAVGLKGTGSVELIIAGDT